MSYKRKSYVLVVQVAMLTVMWAHGAAAQRPLDERLPTTPDGTVKITSAVGRITVEGWARDTVAVTGTLGDPGAQLQFTSEGRETRIRVLLPEVASSSRSPTMLRVYVPRGSHVAVRSSTANIEIEEVEGALDLESVAGDIRIRGRPRMIYAETAGGDVDVNALSKVIRASSLNGDVTVTGARGYIEVSTVGGRARVAGTQVWEGEVRSVSGDIVFRGSFDAGGSFYFESHSGDIDLTIPGDARADFDLTTILSDRVINDFAPSTERTFSIGGGGTQIRVKSFKGEIHIREDDTAGG
jgi:DUF4097 and DUF4098 domain-containing protein YvlB